MKFKTKTIHGHGRGRDLGFPTINMIVPMEIPVTLRQGIYAARAVVDGQRYNGALFYGPAVVFGETKPTLEIYLLDTYNFYAGAGEDIEVEALKYIRPVMNFELPEMLIVQMQKDEAAIRKVLNI